jgi:hypothetical protein
MAEKRPARGGASVFFVRIGISSTLLVKAGWPRRAFSLEIPSKKIVEISTTN